jgi:GntR family transcriptional regulator
LRAHGYTPDVKVLDISEQRADAAIAKPLTLPDESDVLVIKKLFLGNTLPVIYTQDIIPAAFIQCHYDEEDVRHPVYEFLESCCGHILSYYLSDIVPVVADAELAETLQIDPGAAVLAFEEIGYNADGHPILWAKSWFRDDLLRFRLIRRNA